MEKYVPPEAVIKQILTDKLKLWKNTVYDAGIDAQVAKVTADDRMLQGAQKRLKGALKAVAFLEEELNKSQSGDAGE